MSLNPGTILFDKYRLDAFIGRGSCADVFRVTHLGLNRVSALKILDPDTSGLSKREFQGLRQRFDVEARLGAMLNGAEEPNPHLLQVYDHDDKVDRPYLEMEYAPGGSLASRIQSASGDGKPIPVTEVVRMAIEVAQGLAALHERKVVHRDLKPANILFNQKGRAKVADLGLAQTGEEFYKREMESVPPRHPGTHAYMSPEQEARPWPGLTPASDVYALGLVLFETLAGAMFNDQPEGTHVASMRKDVPGWLDELLVRMLSVNPKERPRDGQEASRLLLEGLAEEEARHKEEVAHQEAEEKARRDEQARQKTITEKKVRLEAEKRAQQEAEIKARQEAEKAAIREEQERDRRLGEQRAAEVVRLQREIETTLARKEWRKAKRLIRQLEQLGTEGEALVDGLRKRLPKTKVPVWVIIVIVLAGITGILYLFLKPSQDGQFVPTSAAQATIPATALSGSIPTKPGNGGTANLPNLGGKTITVALENAYPPFNSIDQATGQGIGWDYDIVREICFRINCVPEFKQAAWDGIFPAMQAGEFDMLADGVSVSAERGQMVDFSSPYAQVVQSLMVRFAETRTLEQMKADPNARIGSQVGTTNEVAAKAYFNDKTILSLENFGVAILNLKSGDIDGVVIDLITALIFMKESPGVFKLAGPIASDESLAFAFPKNSPWKDPVNAALAAMTADGVLEQLNKKWGLIPSSGQDSGCTDPIGCVKIGPTDPIHIAYLLVVSGPNSALGTDSRNGVEIAIDDAGGKILGHTIKFDGQDGGCSTDGGQAAATKLAADPTIIAVIGTSCSSEARAGEPLLSAAGFVTISPSNTAPDLTEPGNANNYPGYFRTAHNDKIQGAAAADYAYNFLKLTKVATIHDGSLYADKLQARFAEVFKEYGGTVTLQTSVTIGQTDMSSVLADVAAGSPELVYFPIFMPEGAFLIDQARTTPGLETTKLMVADGLYSPDVVKAAGAAVEGVYVSSPIVQGAAYDAFVAKYQAKFGSLPINIFHAHAYDGFNIVKAAIEKVAVQEADGTIYIPRQALRAAVAATRDFPGLTGVLTCNASGDCANPVIGVYVYHAGQYPPALLWSSKP